MPDANPAGSKNTYFDEIQAAYGPQGTVPGSGGGGSVTITSPDSTVTVGGTSGSPTLSVPGIATLTTAVNAAVVKANNLSDLTNAATARTNLGLGTAAVAAASSFAQAANNLSDLASAATARANLGLGTAATSATSAFDAAGAATTAQTAAIAASAQRASNLSDLASASTARTNLGLGTAATQASTAFLQGSAFANPGDIIAATGAGTSTTISIGNNSQFGAFLMGDPTGVSPTALRWGGITIISVPVNYGVPDDSLLPTTLDGNTTYSPLPTDTIIGVDGSGILYTRLPGGVWAQAIAYQPIVYGGQL